MATDENRNVILVRHLRETRERFWYPLSLGFSDIEATSEGVEGEYRPLPRYLLDEG